MHWNDPRYEEALALHQRVGLIDLHVDSILQQRLFRYDVRQRHRAGVSGQPLIWHADVPRMQDVHYGGACMGIHYWPRESDGGWRELNRQIDYLDRIASEDPRCLRVREPADWDRAHSHGRLAMAPGVEGAHMLNGQLDRVAELAKRQVAYMTLTHFSKNAAATPSLGRGANETERLTDFGVALVGELNRHGIAVDVAHVNTPGVLHACEVTRAPLFCTHTGVKAVKNARRNISDEEISAIAELGGVIGIMCAPNFLAPKLRSPSSVMIDHIDHIVERVGVAHVALGSDFDGWIPLFSDQRDCRDIVKLTDGLLRRGYSETDVTAFLRGNVVRLLNAVWEKREHAGTVTE